MKRIVLVVCTVIALGYFMAGCGGTPLSASESVATGNVSVEAMCGKLRQVEARHAATLVRVQVVQETARACGLNPTNPILTSAEQGITSEQKTLALARGAFRRALAHFDAGNSQLANSELTASDAFLRETGQYLDGVDIFLGEFLRRCFPEDVPAPVIEVKKEETRRAIAQARDSVNGVISALPVVSLDKARGFLGIAEEYYGSDPSFAGLEVARQGAMMCVGEAGRLGRTLLLSLLGLLFTGTAVYLGVLRRDLMISLAWRITDRRYTLR